MEITVKIGNWPVPFFILEDLKNKFPELELSLVEWEWEVPGKLLEAEFSLNGEGYEVEYTVTGHHLLTEKDFKTESLPEAVQQTIKTRFAEAELQSAEHVEYSNGLEVFELNFQQGEEAFEVFVTPEGEVMMKGEDL